MDLEEEQLTQAEDAMWGWYLEWSKIARVAIKNRPLLRQLGFLSTRRGGEEDEETEAPATGTPGTSSTPPVSATSGTAPSAAVA